MENRKIKNANPKEFDGILYRSKLEASFASILKENGVKFLYEPLSFELLPKVKYNGQTIRSVRYTPDFIVGKYIIEAKGFPNDRWGLVKKLIIHKIINEKLPYEFYEVHTQKELKELIKQIKQNGQDQ